MTAAMTQVPVPTATEIDVLASLLDGKGFVDNLGIAEEKEYNFFGSL